MPVFYNSDGKLKKLNILPLDKERTLQKLIQENLFQIWDMHFLASEYTTTSGGRIDTLAIDDNGSPVIIEYKRNKNDSVINQALYYLDWLLSQKVEFFEMLVTKKLGTEKATKIDWKNPRVICVAESYNRYDIGILKAISVKLELYKYQYYENDIFTLEDLKGEDEKSKYIQQINIDKPIDSSEKKITETTLEYHLNKGQQFVRDLFLTLKGRIVELDENIQEKITGNYIVYKVSKSFAEIHIQKSKLLIYLRPITYIDPEKRIFKVSESYNWVLDSRVYINNESDIDYVMRLIEQSYENVL